MPLVGEFSGRQRTPVPAVVLALIAVLALCCVLPRAAFAAHHAQRTRAAVWSVQAPVAAAHLASRRSHAETAGTCANAEALASDTPDPLLRDAVLCLVNRERARFHLPAFHQVRRLTASAQSYTTEMVRDDFFSHTAPNGSTPETRIAATGFRWSWAGENIASGFPTPLSVVTGWMHSQGHCYNLLAPVFADIGVGVSPHPVTTASGPATWTQDFGLPLGASAPSGNWAPANHCPY
jgi:uncharacterized protein YkwD